MRMCEALLRKSVRIEPYFSSLIFTANGQILWLRLATVLFKTLLIDIFVRCGYLFEQSSERLSLGISHLRAFIALNLNCRHVV